MEIVDVAEAVVAVLRGRRDLLVAPALLVRLVGLLLQQALDELLDQTLDLLEPVSGESGSTDVIVL